MAGFTRPPSRVPLLVCLHCGGFCLFTAMSAVCFLGALPREHSAFDMNMGVSDGWQLNPSRSPRILAGIRGPQKISINVASLASWRVGVDVGDLPFVLHREYPASQSRITRSHLNNAGHTHLMRSVSGRAELAGIVYFRSVCNLVSRKNCSGLQIAPVPMFPRLRSPRPVLFRSQ